MKHGKTNIVSHDLIGSTVTKADGNTCGPYRRCPYCGLVDYHHSAQGVDKSHHPITRVGATLRYECGKCRKQFYCLEVSVPADQTPLEFYQQINAALKASRQKTVE